MQKKDAKKKPSDTEFVLALWHTTLFCRTNTHKILTEPDSISWFNNEARTDWPTGQEQVGATAKDQFTHPARRRRKWPVRRFQDSTSCLNLTQIKSEPKSRDFVVCPLVVGTKRAYTIYTYEQEMCFQVMGPLSLNTIDNILMKMTNKNDVLHYIIIHTYV